MSDRAQEHHLHVSQEDEQAQETRDTESVGEGGEGGAGGVVEAEWQHEYYE